MIDQPAIRRYEVDGRAVTIRDGLTPTEIGAQRSKGRKLTAAGSYGGHIVSISPSLVPHPRSPGQAESKPPAGYVEHDQNHFGVRRRNERGYFRVHKSLTRDELYQGCVPALSDVLCGVDPGDALSRRLGGVETKYATAVVEIPGDVSQRRGIILLSVTDSSCHLGPLLRVRVIGESHSYAGDHQYDASATAPASSAPWWIRHVDQLAQEITARVLSGAPATHAFPAGLSGTRGPQSSTFREEFPGIELSGLERMVGARLAAHVDTQKAVTEDLQWAESGPTVWEGISALHRQRRNAVRMEDNLLGELGKVGGYDHGGHWIFRPDVPFETLRNDLLIR